MKLMNVCVFICVVILVLVIFLVVKPSSCSRLENFAGEMPDDIAALMNQKENEINERLRDHEARITKLESGQ